MNKDNTIEKPLSHRTSDGKTSPCMNTNKPSMNNKNICRRTWGHWILLAVVLLLTAIGLATAVPPLISERIISPWPWIKTDLVLLAGLSLTVLAFFGYMSQQQQNAIKLHEKLEQISIESKTRIKQHAERLYALTSISRTMGVEVELQNIFNAMTKLCCETFRSERASLMLYDSNTNELVVKSSYGKDSRDILNIRQEAGKGIAGWVARNRESLLISSPDDYKEYPDLEFNNPSVFSAMVTPVIVRNELVGVLNISSGSPDVQYEMDDLRALQIFAQNAGVCIRHTEHVDWMKKIHPKLKTQIKRQNTLATSKPGEKRHD
jgi:putative methionine-R-sulfoxide reductase with GAF domain